MTELVTRAYSLVLGVVDRDCLQLALIFVLAWLRDVEIACSATRE